MRNLRSRSDAEECGEGKDDDGEKIGELKIGTRDVASSGESEGKKSSTSWHMHQSRILEYCQAP